MSGETPQRTAIRETAEETGLLFAPADLLDLGHFSYRPVKDLHLYAALTERFDAAACHCSSHFTDLWGRQRLEMDGFRMDRLRACGATLRAPHGHAADAHAVAAEGAGPVDATRAQGGRAAGALIPAPTHLEPSPIRADQAAPSCAAHQPRHPEASGDYWM